MPTHFSYDIEFLDASSTGVVLTLGIVAIQGRVLADRVHFRFNIGEQLRRGRTVDAETLAWWVRQSEEARQAAFHGPRDWVGAGLSDAASWAEARGADGDSTWWSKGFIDAVMLESLAKWADAEPLFPWRSARDLRGLQRVAGVESNPKRVTHRADEDAWDQAETLVKALDALGLGEPV